MISLKKSTTPALLHPNQINIIFGHFNKANPALEDFKALSGPNSSISCGVARFNGDFTLNGLRAFGLEKAPSLVRETSSGLRLYFVGSGEDLEVLADDADVSSKLSDFFSSFPNGGGVCNILGEAAAKGTESSLPNLTSLEARMMTPQQSHPLFRATISVNDAEVIAGARAAESALSPHSPVSRAM